jgi:hypothetical protein
MNSKEKKAKTPNVIQTSGAVWDKGCAIDLIRGEGQNAGLRLLTWDGRRANPAQSFIRDDMIYVPLSLRPTIARALLLPAGAVAYGSTGQLFNEISSLVSRVTRLPDSVVTPVVFFIFGTWLTDRLPLAPFLWITAPQMVSTGPLLQVLTLLCRRALLVIEPNLTALRALPMQLNPTILTEVSTVAPAFLKALRASSRRGTLAVVGDKLLDLVCAKAVISNQPLRDPAIAGFPLEIALPSSREYVPRLDTQEAERIASEFQAKFLMYRFLNYARVTKPAFDLSEYTAPVQDVAYGLGACIVGDDRLQRQIIPFLKARDHEIQVERTSLLESIVIEALWAACHGSKPDDLPVTDLTKSVNTILVGRGEAQEVSPEIVGWKLRGLGLRTDFITGGRKGVKLPNETRAMIHSLAAAYGVRTLQLGAVSGSCSVCAALQKEKKTA